MQVSQESSTVWQINVTTLSERKEHSTVILISKCYEPSPLELQSQLSFLPSSLHLYPSPDQRLSPQHLPLTIQLRRPELCRKRSPSPRARLLTSSKAATQWEVRLKYRTSPRECYLKTLGHEGKKKKRSRREEIEVGMGRDNNKRDGPPAPIKNRLLFLLSCP